MNKEIYLKSWKPKWLVLAILITLFSALPFFVIITTSLFESQLEKYEYKLWLWEATYLPSALASNFQRVDPSNDEHQKTVLAYFKLTSILRTELSKPTSDKKILAELIIEREQHEDSVEHFIQSLLHNTIQEKQLTTGFPFLKKVQFVWPPIAIELETPPLLLVRSARKQITRKGDTLLKPGLSEETIISIENEMDSHETVSLIVPIGGLATYPSSILDLRTYSTVLQTAAHEWIHHYLAFYPLGRNYWKSQRFQEINETTANIVGKAIAKAVEEKTPLSFPNNLDGRISSVQKQATTINFSEELQRLRQEVDQLLIEGDISNAELLMFESQKILNQNGFNVRKINQAYFAFYGTYTDLPQSSSPLGPKIKEIWKLTQRDIRTFLTIMREVSKVTDLDETITALKKK